MHNLFPQIAWNLIKSDCLRISWMKKFGWKSITLVWLEYVVHRTLYIYIGLLEGYVQKSLLTGFYFSGAIQLLQSTPGSKLQWNELNELRLSRRQPADLRVERHQMGTGSGDKSLPGNIAKNQLVHFKFYFPTMCFFSNPTHVYFGEKIKHSCPLSVTDHFEIKDILKWKHGYIKT